MKSRARDRALAGVVAGIAGVTAFFAAVCLLALALRVFILVSGI